MDCWRSLRNSARPLLLRMFKIIAMFQSALEGLVAESFTSEQPSQQEEIGLTVYLDNENHPEVQIKLYRYDGSHCLAVVDGAPVSLVTRTSAVDLIEAVHAIVLD